MQTEFFDLVSDETLDTMEDVYYAKRSGRLGRRQKGAGRAGGRGKKGRRNRSIQEAPALQPYPTPMPAAPNPFRQRRNLNRIPPATNLAQLGWLGVAISLLANTQRWAVSITGNANDIVLDPSAPMQLVPRTPPHLLNDLTINAAGESNKIIRGSPIIAAGAAEVTLADLTAVRAVGVRIRVSGPPQGFKFGYYGIELLDNATSMAKFYLTIGSLPADFVVLGFAVNGGLAQPKAIAQPVLKSFNYTNVAGANFSAYAVGDIVTAENITMKDIGLPNMVPVMEQSPIPSLCRDEDEYDTIAPDLDLAGS